MLNYITLLFILTILFLNLTALTSIANRWLLDRAIARVSAVLVLALCFFCIEHFIGLGQLSWLWPVTTLFSLYCIYHIHFRRSHQFTENNKLSVISISKYLLLAESSFHIGVIFIFLWRMSFPNISYGSEQLTDLYFLSNYMPGESLPPADQWLAGEQFNFYYSFQHYTAALMGRLLGLDIGTTYNLAFSVLFGLIIGLAHCIAKQFSQNRWVAMLVVSVIVIGGNGVSPITRLLIDRDYPPSAENEAYSEYAARANIWSTIRFVGGTETSLNTPLAATLFLPIESKERIKSIIAIADNNSDARYQQQQTIENAIKTELHDSPVLSVETLGYLLFAGDYHPPLGGFLMLLFALAIILTISQQKISRKTQILYLAVLGSTAPLSYVINAWVMPLQCLLISVWFCVNAVSYILSRYQDSKLIKPIVLNYFTIYCIPLLSGALICTALLTPFLIGFMSNSLGVELKRVPDEYENPARIWIYFWPYLPLFIIAMFESAWRKITLVISVVLTITFTFSSLLYFDDIHGTAYERFNTVLKWWAWAHALAMAYFIALATSSDYRWAKATSIFIAALMLSFGFELGVYYNKADHTSRGHITGHHWLSKTQGSDEMIAYLKKSTSGIVIENIERGAYSAQSSVALFAGQASLLGWPDHIRGWRNHPPIVNIREAMIRRIYRGELSSGEALDWLKFEKVRYIIWKQEDETNTQFNFESVNSLLSSNYKYLPFNGENSPRQGLWELL